MKRLLTTVSLLVLILLILPVSVFAAPVAANNVNVVAGDVTYTMSTYEDGTAVITSITVAETVTDPIDLVIPASFTIEGESYTVSAVNAIGQWVAVEGGQSYDQYQKIKSVSFEAEELPMIHGNLFGFQNEVPITNIFPDVPIPHTTAASKEYPTIPGFVSNNYNHDSNGDGTNDTYYLGENLVRVDPAYEGDLAVKDGTVSILAGAFWGCSKLEDVTIPDSVEWIGINAFAHSSVTTVNIPQGLLDEGNRIEAWAFQSCEKLTAVTFPEDTDKKVELAFMSFTGCKSLTGFDFSHVSGIDTMAFAFAFAEGTEIDLKEAGYYTSYDNNGEIQFIYHPAVFFGSGISKVDLSASTATMIYAWTFAKCQHLTEVIIPDNITQILRSAFEDCTALAGDVLANTKVSFIDYRAFANNAMTVLTIPETVTNIACGAFAGNEQLETINWKTGNLNSELFPMLNDTNKGYSFPLRYSPARATSTWTEYTPLKTLNIYAMPANPVVFRGLEYLETVNFLCDVTMLQQNNFSFCPSLETVTFSAPEKLTSIGGYAFNGCLNLKSFPFEQLVNLENIGPYAFFLTPHKADSATGLVNGTGYAALSDERKSWGLEGELDLSALTKLTTINISAFYNQYNITKIHLPANLVTYPNYGYGPFMGTASLEELILEGNAPTDFLNSNFFTGETGPDGTSFHSTLKSITVKGSLPANTLFFGMKKLETVNLPNATAFPAGAFMNCTALKTVNAPMITAVGADAFMNSGLEELVIQKDVTYGNGAFRSCKELTTVVVEEGVEELPSFLLEGTPNLKEVSLPETLKTIGWGAFKNSGLKQIRVPAAVLDIHDDAFRGSVAEVVLEGAPTIHTEYWDPDNVYMTEEENNEHAIDATATVYYANADAKTAAELYALALELNDLAIVPCTELTLTAELASDKLLAGEALTGLTVMLNGEALEEALYSTDYDPEDKTLGQRTITINLVEETMKENSVESKTVSATGFDGEEVSGSAANIIDGASLYATVQANVVDHLTHIFTAASDELAEAATCVSPAKYYAKCSVENCGEIDKTVLIEGTDLDPENHTGNLQWTVTDTTHKQVYSCCEHVVISEEPHVDTDPKDNKCDLCDKELPEPDPTEPDPTEPDPTEPDPTEPDPTEPDPTEPEEPKSEVLRIFGENRFETAIKVADELKAKLGVQKFSAIILASGADYADALSGSYLAAVEKAPILLTYKDKENALALDYIRTNLAQDGKVYILGGTVAVSQKVEDALVSYGINYERLGGANRFETNLAVLRKAGLKAGDTVLVATGTNFADCLSASAVGKPIVLTHKYLYDSQKSFLKDVTGDFCIIGGENAVSKTIADELAAIGKVSRLAGENRFQTSVLVAEKFFPDAKSAVLAYAANYPDGLCGGPLAFSMDAPLILTMNKYESVALTYTGSNAISDGIVLGGTVLISDPAVRTVFAMASDAAVPVK